MKEYGILKTTPAVGHPSAGGELVSEYERVKFSSCGGVPAGGGGLSKSVVNFNLPYNKSLVCYAKKLRKAGSLPEALLWREIKGRQINGLDFDRQKVIGDYIVDFFCATAATVIEIDDKTHDLKVRYDMARENFLLKLGLKVIHISAKDVLKNPSAVADWLKSLLLVE